MCPGTPQVHTYVHDVWCWHHPFEKMFTCHSATYRSMSRTDLIYVSSLLLNMRDAAILPQGISVHALLSLWLSLKPVLELARRRLFRYSISDTAVKPRIQNTFSEFWLLNATSSCLDVFWVTFKASLRGQYQAIIGQLHRDRSRDLAPARRQDAAVRASICHYERSACLLWSPSGP